MLNEIANPICVEVQTQSTAKGRLQTQSTLSCVLPLRLPTVFHHFNIFVRHKLVLQLWRQVNRSNEWQLGHLAVLKHDLSCRVCLVKGAAHQGRQAASCTVDQFEPSEQIGVNFC